MRDEKDHLRKKSLLPIKIKDQVIPQLKSGKLTHNFLSFNFVLRIELSQKSGNLRLIRHVIGCITISVCNVNTASYSMTFNSLPPTCTVHSRTNSKTR